MSVLERVPSVGDEVDLDTGKLQVVRMDGRRVDRIRYVPNQDLPAEVVGR
jgi:CBS domain containing-hemolysin-like protein